MQSSYNYNNSFQHNQYSHSENPDLMVQISWLVLHIHVVSLTLLLIVQ